MWPFQAWKDHVTFPGLERSCDFSRPGKIMWLWVAWKGYVSFPAIIFKSIMSCLMAVKEWFKWHYWAVFTIVLSVAIHLFEVKTVHLGLSTCSFSLDNRSSYLLTLHTSSLSVYTWKQAYYDNNMTTTKPWEQHLWLQCVNDGLDNDLSNDSVMTTMVIHCNLNKKDNDNDLEDRNCNNK